MALQLIYGRANSGKTEYILNKSMDLYNSGKPFIIVVPEQYTHMAEKKLIDKIGFIEQGRAEVLSFDRIATRINNLFNNNKNKLSSLAKTLILSEIIQNTDLKYYKNASKDGGFVDVCADEISEFKKYNISCDDLKNSLLHIDNEALKLKLEDIYNIYVGYESAISTKYSDSDDNLSILAENLESKRPYKGYTFLFDEFSSFNPNEKNVILALVKQSCDTYISMCADFSARNALLFKPTLAIADSIANMCSMAGISIKDPVKLATNYFKNKEIAFLEDNIYSYPSGTYEKTPENITVNVFDNPYSEVTELANQIQNIIRKNNARYKDIGVVCPDISKYSHIIKHVFNKYNIPYFTDEKPGVLKHSIVSSVINMLDAYIHGYKCEHVVSYLKSAYINIDRQSLVNIENFISVTNASKNTWLIDDKWKKTLEVYSEGDIKLSESIDKIRRCYILPLSKFHDKIKGRNTVKYVCEQLYNFITEIGFDKNIEEYIKNFKLNNNKQLQKQYQYVWKLLIDAMDTLVLVLGDKKVNVAEFRNYLYMSLREQKIGIVPTSVDSVTIGDVKRSKQDSIKYQFIIGAVDGSFPVSSTDKNIITDADKQLLLNAGVQLSPDTRHKMLYDRFLTYVALTGTDDKLILSYPESDESSNALRPSFVITVLKNVFKNININSYITRTNDLLISNTTDSLEFLSKQATMLAEGKEADLRWQDIYNYHKTNHTNNIEFIDSVLNCNKQIVKLDKDLVDSLFKKEFYSTISRLQRYNSCRYSYYLEYMLGLKDKKSFEPESTDIGTFVHSCIEKTFKRMEAENKSINDADSAYILNVLKDVYAECMPELYKFDDDITPKDEYKIKTVKEKVFNAIMGIKSHFVNSAFVPLGHEITFNDDNLGCIEINLCNNKTLKLTGKIDRADYFDNENGRFIRVVDYKTGNKTFNISDVYYGLDIQLIVYLNALVKGTENGHHAGALFYKIQNAVSQCDAYPDDDEIKKMIMKNNAMTGMITDDEHILNAYSPNSYALEKKATPSQFKFLSDYVEDTVKQSAESLSEGKIEINPYVKSSNSPCVYCSFSSICNFVDGENGICRNLETIRENDFWKKITSKESDK